LKQQNSFISQRYGIFGFIIGPPPLTFKTLVQIMMDKSRDRGDRDRNRKGDKDRDKSRDRDRGDRDRKGDKDRDKDRDKSRVFLTLIASTMQYF
jgi:hypothetical protein